MFKSNHFFANIGQCILKTVKYLLKYIVNYCVNQIYNIFNDIPDFFFGNKFIDIVLYGSSTTLFHSPSCVMIEHALIIVSSTERQLDGATLLRVLPLVMRLKS